jgi:hypothetical protein
MGLTRRAQELRTGAGSGRRCPWRMRAPWRASLRRRGPRHSRPRVSEGDNVGSAVPCITSSFSVPSWVTSSARSSNDCGMVNPSALAVLRLMISSNLVGWQIGGLRTLEDSGDVVGRPPIVAGDIRRVGHQQAISQAVLRLHECGHALPRHKRIGEPTYTRRPLPHGPPARERGWEDRQHQRPPSSATSASEQAALCDFIIEPEADRPHLIEHSLPSGERAE